jgi:hypothetical protein
MNIEGPYHIYLWDLHAGIKHLDKVDWSLLSHSPEPRPANQWQLPLGITFSSESDSVNTLGPNESLS